MEYVGSSSRGESYVPADTTCRRRLWTIDEEHMLIRALETIIQQGAKCENGFRSGYLKQLEKEMKKLIPNCDLRAEPHISSRVHSWKKSHGILNALINTSGFSWDSGKSQIVVENEAVWADYIKAEPAAKPMRYKSFRLYGKWCEIFGNEKATGAQAEDCNIAADKQLPEGQNDNIPPVTPTHNGDEHDSPNTQKSDACSPSSNGKRKKRKTVDTMGDQMVNLMGKFYETTALRLGEMSENFGYVNKMSKKRAQLLDELGKLSCLNSNQRIAVAKMLANNNNDLELFFSASTEDKARLVTMMLTGDI